MRYDTRAIVSYPGEITREVPARVVIADGLRLTEYAEIWYQQRMKLTTPVDIYSLQVTVEPTDVTVRGVKYKIQKETVAKRYRGNQFISLSMEIAVFV